MSKKKIETFEVDDMNLVPELLDGKHHVIPIVTGGDEPVEEVEVARDHTHPHAALLGAFPGQR